MVNPRRVSLLAPVANLLLAERKRNYEFRSNGEWKSGRGYLEGLLINYAAVDVVCGISA